MNIIAAVDKNWGIGYNNKLLVNIPADMKFFREKTIGNVVVMGRKTLESFPNQKPLSDRVNIVLTKDVQYKKQGVIMVHSLEELQEELKQYDTKDIFVLGGGSIYRQLLKDCDTAYITKIDFTYNADVYFPNLDDDVEWEIVDTSEEQTYFDLEYYFLTYKKAAKR